MSEFNALTEQVVRLQSIIDSAVEGIVTIDEDGVINLFNPAAESLFGYQRDEICGRNVSCLMPEPYALSHDGYIRSYLKTGEGKIIGSGRELIGKRKDGSTFPLYLSVTEITTSGKRQFAGVLRDISERKETERQLRAYQDHLEKLVAERTRKLVSSNRDLAQMARMDGLTGIANRRYFDEMLVTEYRRMAREARPLALLMCDIDHFKFYNDSYGHLEGDQCLRDVAALLERTFQRSSDFVARFGGEEFTVILPGTELRRAKLLAERFQHTLSALAIPHESSPVANHVTMSVGLAAEEPPQAGGSPQQLLARSDSALYQAKRAGRNRIVIAAPETETQSTPS